MPVPSSGELKLRADIALEVDGSATGDNVSLGTLSNTAGFSEPDTMSEFYGYSACTVPSVTTNSMSGIGVSSMTANGNVTSDNGCTITERGFYFGTSSNYASNGKYTVSGTTGSFSRGFSVSSSTTYYATAYAINSEGEARGSTISATSSTPITYTFQNNYSMYRETETGNYAVWYGGYNRSYGQYSHSQLGWQTTNSCINGTITNDGYSPPGAGLPSHLCSSNGKSVAYFPVTSSPSVRSSRVYSQHGGTAITQACCADNYVNMGGSGTSLSGYGGGSSCSYSYSSTYCGSSNLNSSNGCTNGGSGGCPTNTGCGCAFAWSGTVTLS
jgi:hypothetical protein